ncbi:SAC3 domain-containing protein 1 isoform X2 [Procambarus clarkii]|nr:uncharacterized protein LOC123768756 isoform X2 [Procambarus clarkii]XP_045615480.1 uncharacterized protein LOC123768756 isoform X2 [Procambarus clarkii]XP_045615481.1 uncharacterized protein LOC123768756 isoform X2 [Procambarus clarkii]
MATDKKKEDTPRFLVGACLGMCPYAEVRLRQRENLVHPLEMAVDSNGGRLNYVQPRAMVKEFSRSAAGHEIKASDIRPLPVLIKTMKYLLTSVCQRQDVSWAVVYQFISDRLRAVRQDLCVQGLKNFTCIQLYLAAVRFYTYAHYRTCEHDLNDFDPYLNKKHLIETLTLVISLFQDQDTEEREHKINNASFRDDELFSNNWDDSDEEELWSNGSEDTSESKIVQDAKISEKNSIPKRTETEESQSQSQSSEADIEEVVRDLNGAGISKSSTDTEQASSSLSTDRREEREHIMISGYSSREEAEALYLLVNFGNEEVLKHAIELRKDIRCSELVSLAIKMNIAWISCNYCRVLQLSTSLPPLFLCAFHAHMTMIQRTALGILSKAHSSKGLVYKQEDLAALLYFPSTRELKEACRHYGLTVTDEGVIFVKSAFNWNTPMMKPMRVKRIEDKLTNIQLSELLLPNGLVL